MPQEFRVGHRSLSVSLLGVALVLLGLAGLVALQLLTASAAALAVLWSALAVVTGFALWRRLGWARRTATGLLASLLPALLATIWLHGVELPLLALLPASGALALALSWALSRLNSRGVRQEFA